MLTCLSALAPSPAHAEGVEIVQAHLEQSDEGYRLSSTFAFDLNHGLEDVINKGVALFFTTEVELKRPRWYWFDDTAVTESQTVRVQFNVLTRQYHVSINDRPQQRFSTLEDALSLVRRPSRWVVADLGKLKVGVDYNVAVRMKLDLAELPKPFQVHALNSSDWRLSSDWKYFTFKAD
jgi:hypothetical protein